MAVKTIAGWEDEFRSLPEESLVGGLEPNTLKRPFGIPRSPLRPAAALYETFSRMGAAVSNQSILASQRINTVLIALPRGLLVSSITFVSNGTAGGTLVNQVFGIYDNQEPPRKLAETVDDLTTAWAANSLKTLNLTNPIRTPYSGFYRLAILVNATTVPTFTCVAGLVVLNNISPVLSDSRDSTVTALPTNLGTTVNATAIPYAYVS